VTPTHYEVLNVPPTASAAEIRAAYLGLVRKLHPDVNRHPDAESVMKIVNDAWSVLGDEASRDTYDRNLFDQGFGQQQDDRSYAYDTYAYEQRLHGRTSLGTVVLVAVLILLIIASAYAGPQVTR
jgi:curved DNA-binding protein CbpA